MARFTVYANICDGNDYIKNYIGGEFDDYDEAYEFWDGWSPDREDVKRTIMEDSKESGTPLNEYDLQIGLWDEDGNDVEFHSESVFYESVF